MEDNFEKLLKEKDYLIKTCITKLNIRNNFEDFFQVGSLALYLAYKDYDPTKDTNNNFEVYAYCVIMNAMKNELKRLNKHQKLVSTIDLYQNDYLAPIIEDNLIEAIDFDELLQPLSTIQRLIIDYRRSGYNNREIARMLKLSNEQVKYQLKMAFNKIRNILMSIDIN